MSMGTGCDPICQHCGRPVLGSAVYGHSGVYHAECTRGPQPAPNNIFWSPVPEPPSVLMRVEQLERELIELKRAFEKIRNTADASGDEVLRKLDEKLAARIQAYRESERPSDKDLIIGAMLDGGGV